MIGIINYGVSNLLSIKRAVDIFSDDVIIVDNCEELNSVDKIILPGVGSFQYGMNCLAELHLADIIIEKVQSGIPLMGICLGMQMLFDESDEGGVHDGLKLIPGRVERIPEDDIIGHKQIVPHIGWERLVHSKEYFWDKNILKNISEKEEFYFVHSYEGKPQKPEDCIASTIYGGRNVCAIVQKENVVGCQFHPEKSGKIGLELIRNFIFDF